MAIKMQLLLVSLVMIAAATQVQAVEVEVKQDCLTEKQKEQLAKTINTVSQVLNTAEAALATAAIFDKDHHDVLQKAAEVVRTINNDLVADLTKIIEEACGSCSQIVQAVQDSVDTITKTLNDIDPNWDEKPLFKTIEVAIQTLLGIASNICPKTEPALMMVEPLTFSRQDCLNETQKEALAKTVGVISNVLNTAEAAVATAAAFIKDEALKEKLQKAVRIIQVINDDLVGNLTKIIEEACGTCGQIVQTVDDAVTVLKDTLDQIDPDWQNNKVFHAVVQAVESVVNIAKQLCPTNEALLMIEPLTLTQDCLNETQKEHLAKIVGTVDNVVRTAEAALATAAAFAKDEKLKANIEKVIKVTEIIRNELVGNLTKIIEEACGTCGQIVKTVDDAVTVLKDTLNQIDPHWDDKPIFKTVEQAIESLLTIAKQLCPTQDKSQQPIFVASVSAASLGKDCLNETQKEALAKSIGRVSELLSTAEAAIATAAIFTKDEALKQKLQHIAEVIGHVNDGLVGNLTKIIEEACGSCSQIIQAVDDALTYIKQTLHEVAPEVENQEWYKKVLNSIESVLNIAHALCPKQAAWTERT